jgi:Ca2+-transporting ATPase
VRCTIHCTIHGMKQASSTVLRRPTSAKAHASTVEALERELDTSAVLGLSDEDAAARLLEDGPNRLSRPERPPYGRIALRQLIDPLVGLLVVAAIVSAGIGEGLEAAVIAAIVLLNGVLGFVQEARSERAVLALREGFEQTARVIRGGRMQEVRSDEIVRGDLLLLAGGDRVAADGRLVEGAGLDTDESILTGESVPVTKSTAVAAETATLAERTSMVYAGTAVTRGRGAALVTATGPATEIGVIASLTEEVKRPPTPLQRRLTGLARLMVVLGIVVTVVLTAGMLVRGATFEEAFLVGVSVAVAAVPEGLAATVTIALALGAHSMAARGAIVRRLAAVETAGQATVICTDKTGTLTENALRVAAVAPLERTTARELLEAAVLASAPELTEGADDRIATDPIEGALLQAAREHGVSTRDLLEVGPVAAEFPFDSDRKRMTVVHRRVDGLRAVTKGAPEVVLERSAADQAERSRAELTAAAWAGEGLRVLAVAERRLPDAIEPSADEVERELVLLGFVALHDPLRPTAAGALRQARDAGLGVKMLTGDHPVTARAIAQALDLPAEDVHARITPADKLRIVEELQERGEVVAVTGDGVNDAPALRRADVGLSMGRSGTEAAREASDIVLTDDDFATIVAAVREGRRIYDNVRKFVAFLLSANLGEVALFAIAILAGLGAPLTVVQILIINVLTDGLPAVALTRDPAGAGLGAGLGPPRGRRLLPGSVQGALAGVGFLVGGAALIAFLVGRELGDGGQTMAFATVGLAELAFVFSCRSALIAPWRLPRNAYLTGSVAASTVLLVLAVYLPVHEALGTVPLQPLELSIVVTLAAVPFAAVELAKAAVRRRRRATSGALE